MKTPLGKPVAGKPDRSARLDALRDKIKNTDLGGNAGFWSPEVGKNVIRILPEVGDMGFFFQPVGRHALDSGKKMVYCPSFTTEGQLPCPICELVNQLYKGDAASRVMAGDLKLRKSYWMNVIVRGKEKLGPQIFTPGVRVFGKIAALVGDQDYGDIMDVNEGLDITVERKGTGLDTEYEVIPKRSASPLGDQTQVNEWLAKAKDITVAELSDDPEEDRDMIAGRAVYLYPYDRIVREYGLDSDATTDDDEEEEPIKPAKKAVVSEPVKKAVKRAPEPEPVEEDDDEEVAAEDDEEDVPPAKQEVQRRIARRAVRR